MIRGNKEREFFILFIFVYDRLTNGTEFKKHSRGYKPVRKIEKHSEKGKNSNYRLTAYQTHRK